MQGIWDGELTNGVSNTTFIVFYVFCPDMVKNASVSPRVLSELFLDFSFFDCFLLLILGHVSPIFNEYGVRSVVFWIFVNRPPAHLYPTEGFSWRSKKDVVPVHRSDTCRVESGDQMS